MDITVKKSHGLETLVADGVFSALILALDIAV